MYALDSCTVGGRTPEFCDVVRWCTMKGRTGFRHDFIFVILTELPAAITQTRGPYTCLKELQPGIPKSIGSVGLRFCCGKFCKNDGD